MRFRAVLQGSGIVEIVAFGVADAEARLEKELRAALPHAAVQVRDIRRTDADPHLVEEFAIAYRIRLEVSVAGESEEIARRAALARARSSLVGTRFVRVSWERPELQAEVLPPGIVDGEYDRDNG